ncbi:MAG: 6-carboxytetrahydropterin synthase [bacterium]
MSAIRQLYWRTGVLIRRRTQEASFTMAYRVCKTLEIESAHLLSHHPAFCRFPHGHTRKVEVVLEADHLDANGMVCDFKDIKAAIQRAVEIYDHALCMNDTDPNFKKLQKIYGDRVVAFSGEPTSERMAEVIFAAVARDLRRLFKKSGARLAKVRVWETSSSWAEFSPASPG